MTINGYTIIARTNHFTITRVGSRDWFFQDCWVRTADGDVTLAGIRTDILDSL